MAGLPGGHGDYIGDIAAPDKNSPVSDLILTMIETFLDE